MTIRPRKGHTHSVPGIFSEFCEEFPTSEAPEFAQRMLEIQPGLGPLSVKDVLTSVFGSREMLH